MRPPKEKKRKGVGVGWGGRDKAMQNPVLPGVTYKMFLLSISHIICSLPEYQLKPTIYSEKCCELMLLKENKFSKCSSLPSRKIRYN